MPQARQSSMGGRKAPPRAHIPYRADDLAHGKKTGISITQVDHRSDEFEPFDEVLGQAGNVTPPHVRARKKRKGTPSPYAGGLDEDGEMSMELDDDANLNSPAVYFTNAPRPGTPSSVNRLGSVTRGPAHTSDIDFDKVPSPRPSSSVSRKAAARQSSINGSAFETGRATSSLVRSSRSDEDSEHSADNGIRHEFAGVGNGDDLPPAQSSSPARRRSFSQIDQDDDEEEDQEPLHLPSSPISRINGHKQRQRSERPPDEDDGDIENEIAQGLQELDARDSADNMDVIDDDQNEPIPEPPKKRVKRDKKAPTKRQRVTTQDLSIVAVPEYDEDGNPLRRGVRRRYKPLEWWRCEKVVYGRRENGFSVVPVIKDIIRVPKEVPEPLGAKHKRGRRRLQNKLSLVGENDTIVFNPEEGWDDNMEPFGIVFDYTTQQDLRRRVACTAKMIDPKGAADNQFFFQKVFGEENFMAAGQLIIPVGGKKPSKGSKDNTYVFCLLEGAIKLQIHRSSFVIATGGMFLVPRGNVYYMENIAKRDARLFFAQARKLTANEEEALQPSRAQNQVSRRASEGGSSRAAITSS